MVVASVSSGLLMFDAVIIIILVIWLGSAGLNRWRRKKYATMLDQEAFQKGSHRAQVLDVRSKGPHPGRTEYAISLHEATNG